MRKFIYRLAYIVGYIRGFTKRRIEILKEIYFKD